MLNLLKRNRMVTAVSNMMHEMLYQELVKNGKHSRNVILNQNNKKRDEVSWYSRKHLTPHTVGTTRSQTKQPRQPSDRKPHGHLCRRN